MLLPPQVIPFLEHEDEEVRGLAAKYLADAHDPAPATADDFWRAIDKLGIEGSSRLLTHLSQMPQTEVSVDRLLAALGDADKLAENTRFHLLRTLRKVPHDLLVRHREELLPVAERLDPETHEHLARRLHLMDQPPESLWEQLVQLAEAARMSGASKVDWNASDRLIEALARHPEFPAEPVMAVLRDPQDRFWLEVLCVQLAGEMRYRPAVDLLIERLKEEESDVPDDAGKALARIGDIESLRKIEALFPNESENFRNTAADFLSRLRCPETETTFIRLLEGEQDAAPRSFLAMGLCELCTTEGLEAVRQVILTDNYDHWLVNLRELLLTVSKMTGYQFPEAEAWQKEADAAKAQRAQRETQLQAAARKAKLGDASEMNALMLEAFSKLGKMSGKRRQEPPPKPPQFPEPRPEPLRRAPVKVGRNDPCSCGSGKKYKKCCLAKDEAAE